MWAPVGTCAQAENLTLRHNSARPETVEYDTTIRRGPALCTHGTWKEEHVRDECIRAYAGTAHYKVVVRPVGSKLHDQRSHVQFNTFGMRRLCAIVHHNYIMYPFLTVFYKAVGTSNIRWWFISICQLCTARQRPGPSWHRPL